MNLLERNAGFLAQAGMVVATGEHRFIPGAIEQVNSWRLGGLGVPFYTRLDASDKPYDELILVGVGLPLEYDRTQHLVSLISGKKLIIEPRDEESVPR